MGRAQKFADSIADDEFAATAVDTPDDVDYGGVDAAQQVAAAQVADPNDEFAAAQRQAQEAALAQTGQVAPNVAAQGAAAAQQQPADAQQGWLKDYLVNTLGFSAIAAAPDDQAAFGQLIQHVQQQQQQAQQQYQQQIQALQWQLQQYAARPAAPATAPQAAQPAPSKWQKAPDFDLSLVAGIDPETGLAKPGYDPRLPQQYREWQQYQQGLLKNLGEKGPDFLWENGLADKVEAMVKEQAQRVATEQLAGYQATLFGQQLGQQHAHWMFQQGLNGQPQINPATGQPLLTPEGQQALAIFTNLANQGVPHEAAWNIAYNQLTGRGSIAMQATEQLRAEVAALKAQLGLAPDAPIPAQQQPQTPAQLQAQRNQQFLDNSRRQASRQPNRNGNGRVPSEPATPLPAADWYKALLERALANAGPIDYDA